MIVRPLEPGDEHALLRAHRRVFGRVDPKQRAKTPELWRWQFIENPAGSRSVVALDERGEIRAQYAGLRQRVRTEVGLVHFVQAVDSLHAHDSPGLSRTSAFVRAGERFIECFCGEGDDQDQVVFGLAVPSAWRTGARMLGYEHLRTVNALAAHVAEFEAPLSSAYAVESAEHCPPDIDRLFAELARERGAIAVRDREFLEWRFARHPEQRYSFGIVRSNGALRGLGVFRTGAFAGIAGGLVCDWLVPSADEGAQDALSYWFKAQCLHSGARELVALLPDTAHEWLAFQRRGFRVLPTEYVLAARAFRRPFDRDFLFWRWYYTLCDTDLA